MSEFVRAVRDALEAHGAPSGKMGYSCAPFRPGDGPLSDRLIKVFRGGRDPELLEQLARRHDTYTECLARAGLRLPETRFVLLNHAGHLQPVIVQAAMPDNDLLRRRLDRADIAALPAVLDAVARDVAAFWRNVAQRPERIGLRPFVGNFAIDTDGPVFIGTFPPLIGYSRDEMGRLLMRFSTSALVRGAGSLWPERVRATQDNWYSIAGNIRLLVGSALRQRPDARAEIIDWAIGFASARLDGESRTIVLDHLARAPVLPVLLASTRRALGLRDRPHV